MEKVSRLSPCGSARLLSWWKIEVYPFARCLVETITNQIPNKEVGNG